MNPQPRTQRIGTRFRSIASPWVFFFLLILAAWGVLFAMAAGLAEHAGVEALGPGMDWTRSILGRLSLQLTLGGHHVHSSHESWFLLTMMWGLMAVAMMAPTAVPMLQTYRDLVAGNPSRMPRGGFWFLAAGYVVVWIVFSAVASTAQGGLAKASLITELGVSASLGFSAALLAVAGLFQFSPLKEACLTHCRSPMAFFLSRWRDGHVGAFVMGLRHGAVCVGCCWALMLLAFVGGTMNLVWMSLAMVVMIVEKLSIGRWLTAPLGIALIGAAGILATRAFMDV